MNDEIEVPCVSAGPTGVCYWGVYRIPRKWLSLDPLHDEIREMAAHIPSALKDPDDR